jgi:hypothetical protein
MRRPWFQEHITKVVRETLRSELKLMLGLSVVNGDAPKKRRRRRRKRRSPPTVAKSRPAIHGRPRSLAKP